jgi:multicomponent Na+:H+ antiporter subunit E
MNILLLNLLLALAWLALTGQFTGVNFLAGFALGFLVLWLSQRPKATAAYVGKLTQVVDFILYFLWELVKANVRVTYEVLTPTHHMLPGVIAIPLDLETDLEILVLTSLITLTPGTLSLDISEDRKILYIHAMFIEDRERLQKTIKEGFERRVREVLR